MSTFYLRHVQSGNIHKQYRLIWLAIQVQSNVWYYPNIIYLQNGFSRLGKILQFLLEFAIVFYLLKYAIKRNHHLFIFGVLVSLQYLHIFNKSMNTFPTIEFDPNWKAFSSYKITKPNRI